MTGSGEETAITYHTGERVELGDIVMEPVNGDTSIGVVVEVILPNSKEALNGYDVPSGGVAVKWDSPLGLVLMGAELLQDPDEYIFFVRRKNESPKTLTYCGGEQVELGDLVMRSENGDTKGVVVYVILSSNVNAIWHGVRSGGVVVKWDGLETEVTIGSDVLQEEVNLVRRMSE